MITCLALILALSLDTFMASLSYAVNHIKIPFRSNFVISFLCSIMLLVSILVGSFLGPLLPNSLMKTISFLILFGIGSIKLFESSIKKWMQKKNFQKKEMQFSLFNLRVILSIYSDFPTADFDRSKSLSIKEAILTAFALSLDGLTAGLAFGNVSMPLVLVFGGCLIINIFFVYLAEIIGKLLEKKLTFDFSFIGGLLFLVLAVTRIL